VAALSDRSKLFTEGSLTTAFRYLDANRSGFLEKEELREALKLAEGK
jgi:Ca2+-binding EF-hand superfamily protein